MHAPELRARLAAALLLVAPAAATSSDACLDGCTQRLPAAVDCTACSEPGADEADGEELALAEERLGGERVALALPARPPSRSCGGVADLTAQVTGTHRHLREPGGCAGLMRASLTNHSASTAFCGVAPVRGGGTLDPPTYVTVRPGETASEELAWCGFPEGSIELLCVEECERDYCLMEQWSRLRAR